MARLDKAALSELVRIPIKNFFEHRMTTYAAALAYRGLFGLFPFVLLVVTLLAILPFDTFFERLVNSTGSESPDRVQGPLGPIVEQSREQAGSLRQIIRQAQKQASGGLLSFSVAVSMYSVYVASRTLAEALNAAYGVDETRPGWKRIALTVLFGPALALMFVTAAGLLVAGPWLINGLSGLIGLQDLFVTLWSWLRLPVALVLLILVLSVVYRFAPDTDQPYRFVTPGAAVAVVSWVILSLGFSFYLSNFADYGATYGSLGAAIGLLFYFYLSASVVLFGAEIDAFILKRFERRRSNAPR
ncbi:MAG: YihY/virulence factor BrkB family protein [Rubrobacteraceae bacterium]